MATVKGSAHPGVSGMTPYGLSQSNSRRSSRSMLEGNRTNRAVAKEASAVRLGAAHDLPSSVAHFLYLCSSSSTPTTAAVATKELRRQLLVLRDHCVSVGNKTKDKELLSQGGKHIARKTEATPDFNSCLDVIFSASLVFTSESEDVARETLRSIVTKIKAVQEMGDERAFRSAVVEVVNRILLCTPLAPPARDPSSKMPSSGVRSAEGSVAARHKSSTVGSSKGHHFFAAAEPQLRDECLDFLTVEDGTPVLLERVWRRWLIYFEQGFLRYVGKLRAEQQQAAAAAATAATAHEDEYYDDGNDGGESGGAAANGDAAAAASRVPVIAAVPYFTVRQSYWRSTTSAYAQFCHLLLAIYFVRTKDFSLNYLARVTKLVQYFAYQLDSEDGEPIAVKDGGDAEGDEDDEEDEEDEEDDTEDMRDPERSPTQDTVVEDEAAAEPARVDGDEDLSRSEAAVQTDAPEPEQLAVAEEAAEVRSLPSPQYHEAATCLIPTSAQPSTEDKREEAETAATPPPPPPLAQPQPHRHHWHRCFTTQELPEELRPSTELAAAEEELDAEARGSDVSSQLPMIRLSDRIDLPDVSPSRCRERLSCESAKSKSEAEAEPAEDIAEPRSEAEAENVEKAT